jgi:hypothetical protein
MKTSSFIAIGMLALAIIHYSIGSPLVTGVVVWALIFLYFFALDKER